eukprot:8560126-Alexandrium_andersonii.AAC.1
MPLSILLLCNDTWTNTCTRSLQATAGGRPPRVQDRSAARHPSPAPTPELPGRPKATSPDAPGLLAP